MKKFEVGKTYFIKSVLINDCYGYTCLKRNKKSIVFYDNFYHETIRKKLECDLAEFIKIEGYILEP